MNINLSLPQLHNYPLHRWHPDKPNNNNNNNKYKNPYSVCYIVHCTGRKVIKFPHYGLVLFFLKLNKKGNKKKNKKQKKETSKMSQRKAGVLSSTDQQPCIG